MIRAALTEGERAELRARTRTADRCTRARLEMVRLADAGWPVPRIARHLGCHEQTARRQVAAFLAGGFAALPDRPRSGRPPRLAQGDLRAPEALLDAGGRTWTARQLVEWLARERAVRVHPDHLRRVLRGRGFAWKRTAASVAHRRRDPAAYDAKVAELGELETKRAPA